MAWTTPKTFTAGSVLTAAELNTHLRDNLNETCPSVALAAGDIIYADAANSMGSRLVIGNTGSFMVSDGSAPKWRLPNQAANSNGSLFTFTNTSWADLDAVTGGTAGFTVQTTVTTGTSALVLWRARMSNNTAGEFTQVSYRVSNATTSASATTKQLNYQASAANDVGNMGTYDFATLTAGTNVFELQAQVTGGTGSLRWTYLTVIPF